MKASIYLKRPRVEKNGASEKAAHAWLDAVVARGGTNMHEALAAALSQPSHEGMLPVVLFLTGRPSHDRPHFGKIHCGSGGGRKQGGKAHFHHRGGGGRQRPPAEAHGGRFPGGYRATSFPGRIWRSSSRRYSGSYTAPSSGRCAIPSAPRTAGNSREGCRMPYPPGFFRTFIPAIPPFWPGGT